MHKELTMNIIITVTGHNYLHDTEPLLNAVSSMGVSVPNVRMHLLHKIILL